MYCPNCGTKINENDHFCTNCGHQLNQQTKPYATDFVVEQCNEEYPPVKTDKKKKKKKSCLGMLLRAIITFFFFLIVFSVFGSNNDDSASPTISETVKPSATPIAVSTTSLTLKPTSTPKSTSTPQPTDSSITVEDVEAIKKYLSVFLSESYSYYDISGDETGFTINVSGDGLAEAVALYKSLGKGADSEEWVTVKDSLVYLYKVVYETIETFGMDDPALMMSVVNDQNHDYYLLIVADGGTIIYDVLAE